MFRVDIGSATEGAVVFGRELDAEEFQPPVERVS